MVGLSATVRRAVASENQSCRYPAAIKPLSEEHPGRRLPPCEGYAGVQASSVAMGAHRMKTLSSPNWAQNFGIWLPKSGRFGFKPRYALFESIGRSDAIGV